MDGFANGSHYYAEMPHASWQQWLGEYLDPWFKGIISKVKAQYQPYRSRIVRFILTGGSSLLVADKVRSVPSCVVLPTLGLPMYAADFMESRKLLRQRDG